jgi:OPT family oligopeptide transporter
LQVFIAIAIILGDGLYKFAMVLTRTVVAIAASTEKRKFFGVLPVNSDGRTISGNGAAPETPPSFDDARRTEFFLKDQIPTPVAIGGYVTVAAVSITTVPHLIFPQLKWHHVLAVYLMAPVLAFCNAYGMGLTDWSLASTYSKLAIFVFGAWAGKPQSGVLVGLAACGIMMSIVSTAADLMQDFKTGYMTLASPRSMFVSQVVGTAMGCVVGPSVFWLFYRAFDGVGRERSAYPAPYALIYRNMAILGVDGFSKLPKHCITLCCVFFVGAIALSAEEGDEVHTAPYGDGDSVLHRPLLRHRHVPGQRGTVRVGKGGQGAGGRVWLCRRVRLDLRRRGVVSAAGGAVAFQRESADLHEVSVKRCQLQSG